VGFPQLFKGTPRAVPDTKINKDTVTKLKNIDKVLENIDSKVTEVESSNHQVLNMMKMLETQVG
jgi:hypothetical protein